MNKIFNNSKKLIEELKKGNVKAFSFLMDTYYHRLCVYAKSLTKDSALSEDIVQNVFIRTWEKRVYLKTKFSINNFLYKSVYNEFIDQYRKKKAIIPLEKKHIEALEFLNKGEDENSIEKLIILVNNAIQNLPTKFKITFLLSKKEGLSNIEISEYLGISVKTVEARITKSFLLIRKEVQ